jgi:hypothetical protein
MTVAALAATVGSTLQLAGCSSAMVTKSEVQARFAEELSCPNVTVTERPEIVPASRADWFVGDPPSDIAQNPERAAFSARGGPPRAYATLRFWQSRRRTLTGRISPQSCFGSVLLPRTHDIEHARAPLRGPRGFGCGHSMPGVRRASPDLFRPPTSS